jgi:very-short-patch-repair endonuclease
VVGYFAAAFEWESWKGRTTPVDIIVPRRLRSRTGIRVHQDRRLRRESTTASHGLLVTTPARTMLDLAAVMYSDRHFARVVHEAQVQRKVTIDQMRAEIDLTPRHLGAARLARELEHGPTPTRSGLEDAVVELLRTNDFPRFDTNAWPPATPAWVEVDVIFRDQKHVIEVDGDRWHGTPYRRRLDAVKQSIVERAGYIVTRLEEDALLPPREAQTLALIRSDHVRAAAYS